MTKPTSAHLETIHIAEHVRRPDAVIAALMSAGHAAIAGVAAGACWEDEDDLAIPRSAAPHARDMARIWRRAADHLQGAEVDLSRGRARAGSARSARDRSRGTSLQH